MTTSNAYWRYGIAVAILSACLALQQFAVFPWHNSLTNSLSNWAHVPLFAVITLVVQRAWTHLPWYVLVAIVAAIALFSEALQLLTSRTASVADLLRDGLGLALGLAFAYRLRSWTVRLLVTTAVTLGVPATFVGAYAHHQLVFPTLYDPSDVWFQRLLELRSEGYRTDKHEWQEYADETVLAVEWRKTKWTGVHFLEPVEDWHTFNDLVIDVFNREADSQPLTVALQHKDFEGTARFHRWEVTPGYQQLTVPLRNLIQAPDGNPARVKRVILHSRGKHWGKRFYFGKVWLR